MSSLKSSPSARSGGAGRRTMSPSSSQPGANRGNALAVSGMSVAEKMLAKKLAKEKKATTLTQREQANAVGGWLFGEGGVRGLSLKQKPKAAGLDDGLLTVKQDRGGRGAHHGPTRLDIVMEKYNAQTMQAKRKREEEAMREGAKPREMRIKPSTGLKHDIAQSGLSCWRSLTRCLDSCWNGPPADEAARLDEAPIVFGGIYRKVVERVGVSQAQLRKLRKAFRRIDFSNMTNVSLLELYEYLEEPESHFVDRLYSQLIEAQIGHSPDKVLNFENFVLFVLVFGLMTETELLRFIFDTFDIDGSGHLDEAETCILLKVINHDKPLYPGNFSRMLTEFDSDGDGYISFKEFIHLHKAYPSALFPAFRLHDKIQRKTLGLKDFVDLAERAAAIKKAPDREAKLDAARRAGLDRSRPGSPSMGSPSETKRGSSRQGSMLNKTSTSQSSGGRSPARRAVSPGINTGMPKR